LSTHPSRLFPIADFMAYTSTSHLKKCCSPFPKEIDEKAAGCTQQQKQEDSGLTKNIYLDIRIFSKSLQYDGKITLYLFKDVNGPKYYTILPTFGKQGKLFLQSDKSFV
jgi:hypothetical protein